MEILQVDMVRSQYYWVSFMSKWDDLCKISYFGLSSLVMVSCYSREMHFIQSYTALKVATRMIMSQVIHCFSVLNSEPNDVRNKHFIKQITGCSRRK